MVEAETYKRPSKRVLVLGFDAATFDFIKPMVKEGKLPNFKKLMTEGCYGDLQSTLPPITPPAWASFITGKNPGKHGVYNFHYHSLDPSKDNENYFVNSLSIKTNTLWEILSQRNKENIVINVPVTYPLTNHFKGIIISGMLTPSNVQDFIYPRGLDDEIRKNVGPYTVDAYSLIEWGSMTVQERIEYFLNVENLRTETALYLARRHPWDFFMVMFSFTDKVLHLAHHHLFLDYPESRKLAGYVYKAYEKADEILGRFMEAIGEDTDILVASDHGFGRLEKGFLSNRWLVDNGYMTLRKATLSNFGEIYQIKYKKMPIDRVLMKLRIKPLRGVLPYAFREKVVPIPRFQKRTSRNVVNWERTTAFGSDYGIRINLRGREKCGIVEPGDEFHKIRNEIMERLYDLKDPETDEKLMDHVWKREEVFSGPYAEHSPDLIYMMKGLRYVQFDSYYFGRRFLRSEFGTHRMNGIFLMKGASIKKGCEISGAHITDVAPTILYSMGIPVQDDMDGKVLSDVFEDKFLMAQPVQTEPALPFLREEGDDRDVYTEEEQDEIKKSLQGLGYW